MFTKKELKIKATEYFAELEKNQFLVIKGIKNKLGQEVADLSVNFDEFSGFFVKSLRCRKAESLGLGDCKCEDHPTFSIEMAEPGLIKSYIITKAKMALSDNTKSGKKAKASYDFSMLKKKIEDFDLPVGPQIDEDKD